MTQSLGTRPRPEPPRGRRSVAHAVGASVLAAVIGVAVIGAVVVLNRDDGSGTTTSTAASANPASPSPSGLIDGQRINQVELKAGDCVRSATSDGVGDLSVVPCAESHIGEVTGVYRLTTKGAYPGENAVVADAEKRCERFTPPSLGESTRDDLQIYFVYPREATWAVGDREVQCLVVAEKPLTKRLADL